MRVSPGKKFWTWCARVVDPPVGSCARAARRTNPRTAESGRRAAKVLPSIPPRRKKTVPDTVLLVVDTSVLLPVLLNEPTRRALVNATEGYSLVGAPSLPWEIGNALVAGVRRKRISAADVQQAFR